MTAPIAFCDLDAEEALLGSLLLDTGRFLAVRESLSEDDFYRESHGLIFAAMSRLWEAAGVFDEVTLADDLAARGILDKIGGRAYIWSLRDRVPTAQNASHYGAIVLDHAKRREIIRELHALSERASDPAIGLDTLETSLGSLARPWSRSRTGFDALVESGDDWAESAEDEAGAVIAGQIAAGGIVLVVSDPKRGKTWWIIELAQSVANGRPFLGQYPVLRPGRVLYIGTEGTKKGAGSRFHALGLSKAVRPFHNIDLIWRKPVMLDDPAFIAWLRERAHDYVLIVVDVLRDAWIGDENKADQASPLMIGVRSIANEGATVVLTHHMNKPAEGKARSLSARIRGSSAFHGAADSIIYLDPVADSNRVKVTLESRDDMPAAPYTFALPGEWIDGSEPYDLDWQPADGTSAGLAKLRANILRSAADHPGESKRQLREHVSGRTTLVAEEIRRMLDLGQLVERPTTYLQSNGREATRHGIYVANHTDQPALVVVPSPGNQKGTREPETVVRGGSPPYIEGREPVPPEPAAVGTSTGA